MNWMSEFMAKYRKNPAGDRLQIAERGISEAQKHVFGARIRKIREDQGVLQEDAAKELGYSQTALSYWENGARFPSSHELLRLSGYYGVPVIEMLGGSEEAQKKLRPANLALIPVVGEVQAGTLTSPSEAVHIYEEEFPEGWDLDGIFSDRYDTYEISEVMFKRRRKGSLVIGCRVKGKSMAPEYKDNDLILVERIEDLSGLVRHRDHVVVDLTGQGEYALKIYLKNLKALGSINPDFDPILWTKRMRFFGVVTGMFRMVWY